MTQHVFRLLLFAAIAAVLIPVPAGKPATTDDSPWRRSARFEELSFTTTIESNVRIHVNAPLGADGQPARATRLIVYALPNGNTIEQTLGSRMTPGLDWHYDIQHVAAQVRLLRSLDTHVAEFLRNSEPRFGETRPRERIVLVCAEAPGLSWPTFRRSEPDANAKILALVEQWRRQFGNENTQVTLTGHSGGGSFMFGVIEAAEQIPDYIDRIAFLDANYSFDAVLHASKFERWLTGDDRRRLIVLAYDDREITLDGKKVVGPDGGTYRATGRMRDALVKSFELAEATNPPFIETFGLDGRIHFYVHPNPHNKILHTVLVGEMNGLVHIETLGTPHEAKWGTFGGPRAYSKWIEPSSRATLPSRPREAIVGSAFIERLNGMSLDEREAAIFGEISSGNFPDFLRDFKTVSIRGQAADSGNEKEIVAWLEVMPDYLAVGSNDDFVRMPMTPQTAQRIADRFHCVLPTRKLVDAIDAQAELHLPPRPLTQDREAVGTFLEHHRIIEEQRAARPLGLLISGIKKDIVLSPSIFERPQRLAIYGWRQLDGNPIQPLTIVHWNRYVDYSHGARLIADTIQIGGEEVKIADLLADPNRCSLVSDEGPMNPPRYPAE